MNLNEQTYRIKQMMGVINEERTNPGLSFVRRRLDVIENVIERYNENNQYTMCDMKWSDYWEDLEEQVIYGFYWEVIIDLKIENKVWENMVDFIFDILRKDYYAKLKEDFEFGCN